MAVIGCMGEVIFEVSSETVKTLDEIEWSSSANYAEHKLYQRATRLEFTGLNADEISFEIKLCSWMGVNPMLEMVKLLQMERNGEAATFVLGSKAYGKGKWVITSSVRKLETIDGNGNLRSVSVSLKLKAYEERSEQIGV